MTPLLTIRLFPQYKDNTQALTQDLRCFIINPSINISKIIATIHDIYYKFKVKYLYRFTTLKAGILYYNILNKTIYLLTSCSYII